MVGEITYKSGGATHTLAVAWGFAEVLPDKVTILAETAERPQEIDVARAEKAKERAEERLKSNSSEVDYDRAEDALQRAETRIKVASEKKTSSVAWCHPERSARIYAFCQFASDVGVSPG